MGTAPLAMTTRVCSDVPEAMFVSAHAASNWSIGLSPHCRNCTKRGTTPAAMTSSIGGERSIESSFLNCVTAGSCMFGSSECTPSTSACGFASAHACDPTVGMPASAAVATWGGPLPPKRFLFTSSFLLSLRRLMLVSSRPRRASVLSSCLKRGASALRAAASVGICARGCHS